MRSFLSYRGGKSLLASKIIKKIPEHTCYCEVFAGAAWLLFGKEESKVEIINDINKDLVTLYRVIKNHLEEFVRREDYRRLRDVLTGIKGRFILSINDVPEIREIFQGFFIEEVKTSYTISGANKQQKVTEPLIQNYELPLQSNTL